MSFRVAQVEPYIRAEFTGIVDTADLLRAAAAADEIEEARSHARNRLIDLSGATELAVNFEDVDRLAKSRAKSILPVPVRTAIVAPGPVQFGIGRMYQSLMANPSIEVCVFRTETEALAWIGAAR